MQRKLFVIGPSQSGKTCLAVGLANTSYGKTLFRRAFRAKAGGQESQLRLSNLTKMIEGEKWPEGNIGKYPLDFVFEKKGKTERFFFNDYKGEDSTSPAFLKELGELDNNDGVILLVNPGFNFLCVRDAKGNVRRATDAETTADRKPEGYFVLSAFDDSPLAREWLVDQKSIYDQLIRNLNTKNNGELKAVTAKPVVAVVVTASDRIGREGDLLAIRPQFEKFLAQIATGLETAGFEWRSFKVSITGVLADQSKPRLELGLANTPARPFLWVLHKLWWRSVRGKWTCAAKWAAGMALVAGLCFCAYEWKVADKANKDIRECVLNCESLLAKDNRFGLSDLKTCAEKLEKLREHSLWRFYAGKAKRSANKLEPDIWEKQRELINTKIKDIKRSDGKRGATNDIKEVDELFSGFTPILPDVSNEFDTLRNEWKSDKPEVRIKHCRYVLRDSNKEHGLSVMDKLYSLAYIIKDQKSATEGKAELAEELDRRVGDEWREFAIPDFARSASTNATQKTVREFQTQLKKWTPVTTNGASAKVELIAHVATNALLWRMDYAVNGRSLEALAELYPARFPTNEFLSAEFVSEQWSTRGKPAFDKACKAYLDGIVSEIKERPGRPTLKKSDKDEVEAKANAVGVPFDRSAALDYMTKKVDEMVEDWVADKRRVCHAWVKENINKRPNRKRTGIDSLWDAYTSERRNHLDDEDIFNEIVRSRVYIEAEKWLEEDIDFFCSVSSSLAEKEARFNDLFKPLCGRIKEDDKHYDPTSWAYPFVVNCIDIGKINDNFANAFSQSFEVTKVLGRINYDGKDPWEYGYKGTQIWLSAVKDGIIITIVPRVYSDATLINEKKKKGDWKQLWTGQTKVQGSMAYPVNLYMEVEDRRTRDSNQAKYFYMPLSLHDKDGCGSNGTLEFGGQFGTRTEDRAMAAYCSISVRRTSGKGVKELLAEARREAKPVLNSGATK